MQLVEVGDVVRTEESWGVSSVTRLRCSVCGTYMARSVNPVCTRCGSSYRLFSPGFHQVVARGRA